MQSDQASWHGTTILTVRKGGLVAIGGDGQVSIGQTIVKANAKKVRKLGKGDVIGGFAGATADAFTLFERLEGKLEQYPGQLTRAAVELAKDWRTDRYLRRLEAMMIVADKDVSLVITGAGDVLEPEAGTAGIGSGGNFALASARALLDGPLDAESHRAPLARHCGRHLRLHQPQRDDRDAERRLTHGGAGVSVSSHDGGGFASRSRMARDACMLWNGGATQTNNSNWSARTWSPWRWISSLLPSTIARLPICNATIRRPGRRMGSALIRSERAALTSSSAIPI